MLVQRNTLQPFIVRLNAALYSFSRPLSRTLRIDDIDDEPCSSSESWLLISQSRADPEVPLTSVASVTCQTTTPLPAQDQPRANVKKNLLLHREEPLQPPTFKLKSKLPRLHYGGLEIPELHCFTSFVTAHSGTDTQVYNSLMRPTAKSLPSPATFRKATTSLQSTAQKDESDADRARSVLKDIFYMMLVFHPSCIVRSTLQHLLINISTALPTV